MGPSFRWGVGARGWTRVPQGLASCPQPKLGANVTQPDFWSPPPAAPMPLPIHSSLAEITKLFIGITPTAG